MKNHLNMTENPTSGIDFGGNIGFINAMVILADIEAELGTKFGNASQRAENESFHDKFKGETGWTYGDAVDMAAECQRESRLFGTRS